jgi:hypothetical protein
MIEDQSGASTASDEAAPTTTTGGPTPPERPSTACRVVVAQIGSTGSWHFWPVDDAGNEAWKFKLEWNRHSGFFRGKAAAVKAATRLYPGLEVAEEGA